MEDKTGCEQYEDVENWLTSLSRVEVDETLVAMELATSGNPMDRKHRLYNWLMGEYSASEFASAAYGGVKREELGDKFIQATVLEHSSSTIAAPHPLAQLTQFPPEIRTRQLTAPALESPQPTEQSCEFVTRVRTTLATTHKFEPHHALKPDGEYAQ